MQFENTIRVGFTFQQIKGTWVKGGKSFDDDNEKFEQA